MYEDEYEEAAYDLGYSDYMDGYDIDTVPVEYTAKEKIAWFEGRNQAIKDIYTNPDIEYIEAEGGDVSW